MPEATVPIKIEQEEPKQKTNGCLSRSIPGSINGDKFLIYWRCGSCGIVRGVLMSNGIVNADNLGKYEMFMHSNAILFLVDDLKDIPVKTCPLCKKCNPSL